MRKLGRRAALLAAVALASPPPSAGQTAPEPVRASPYTAGCADLVAAAVAAAGRDDLAAAEHALGAARSRCPGDGVVHRELAGLRFRQGRYAEAALLAERRLTSTPDDAYAGELLASSRFLLDDADGALRAWNRLGRPLNRRTVVTGLGRTPAVATSAAVGIAEGDVITADALNRARRRVAALPTVRRARVEYRPVADGVAEVDVAVAERPLLARSWPDLVGHGLSAGIHSRLRFELAGLVGAGELWSAEWSWLRRRSEAAIGVAAPGFAGLPGVLELSGEYRRSTFRLAGGDGELDLVDRRGVGLAVHDWAAGGLHWRAGAMVDRWAGRGTFAGVQAALGARAPGDRVAARISIRHWRSPARREGFHAARLQAAARSPPAPAGTEWSARAGLARASGAAPPDLWAGAGTGRVDGPLLRAHRLTDGDGTVRGRFFGPFLGYAGVELCRWWRALGPLRIGGAGFLDAAAVHGGREASRTDVAVDAGVGLRLGVPGLRGTVRADVAHGLADAASAFSVGWSPDWPGWW